MTLRLAGHLGVRAPDAPLFKHLAAADATAQIAFLAAQGFAGANDNYLLLRTPEAQADLGRALKHHGLTMGSFVHDPLNWNRPVWSGPLEPLRAALDIGLAAAARTGGRTINIVTGRDPLLTPDHQRGIMAANLRTLGDRADAAGVRLCVEATHPTFAPGLLVERWVDALDLVRSADHPAVRLTVDIGHIALHGDDPVAAITTSAPWIGIVQAADLPGRVEPGAGELNWPAIAAALAAAEYSGLIELELEPAVEGAAGERAMLARLATLGWLP